MGEQVTVLELMAQASASTPGPAPPPPAEQDGWVPPAMADAAPSTTPAPEPGPPDEELIDRVQRLTGELESITDPGARAIAEQLMAALLELYGEGLERILALVGDEAAREFADDGVVASLLLIHDLYPVPLEERVAEALAGVRPYMESHGGDVQLLSLEEGVATLRLSGSCDGCAASSATLELAIKKALMESAPDLLGLEVEGVAEPPAHPPLPGTPLPLAPTAGNGAGRGTWTSVPGVVDLPDGVHAGVTVDGTDLLVANVNGTLLAYVDSCAACSSSLGEGLLSSGVLSCPRCSQRFDLPRAGRAVDQPDVQLGPVPLLVEGSSEVRVALAS
jgi:Fe-S cluster biogenesis protein NfuA/nitrite reductase/ring-hydroxylating ferredoxin subunit